MGILFRRIAKAVKYPRLFVLYLKERPLYWSAVFYNFLVDLFKGKKTTVLSGFSELDEIRTRSLIRTDISDHLTTLFVESLIAKPTLIVELGVRGGESTYVLERVARLSRAKLVSVDLQDCSLASTNENWHFVRSDDVVFAAEFENWCRKKEIRPMIDVLFIDTSHLFEHTHSEITAWFPFLSSRAKVFFHDTNLKRVYFRKDGSMGIGWNNRRGVIRAVERYLNRTFNERANLVDFSPGWLVRHFPYCAGFTILEKFDLEATMANQRFGCTD